MATFVLIHGAGSDGWYWHRVRPLLEAAGHDTLAVDLPTDDDAADFGTYTDVVVDAVGDRGDLVIVGQSLGGFTAPMVADRLGADLLVLVAAMIPAPGESGGDWWANTGHEAAYVAKAVEDGRDPEDGSPEVVFVHDLDPDLVAASLDHVKDQSGTPFADPWPLPAWPDVPTRVVIARDDRFFPAEFQRRVTRERLGITPDEVPGGHLPALGHPGELADLLLVYAAEVS
jgi:pimeloyl-ACP methyl ester carboxylesterase